MPDYPEVWGNVRLSLNVGQCQIITECWAMPDYTGMWVNVRLSLGVRLCQICCYVRLSWDLLPCQIIVGCEAITDYPVMCGSLRLSRNRGNVRLSWDLRLRQIIPGFLGYVRLSLDVPVYVRLSRYIGLCQIIQGRGGMSDYARMSWVMAGFLCMRLIMLMIMPMGIPYRCGPVFTYCHTFTNAGGDRRPP